MLAWAGDKVGLSRVPVFPPAVPAGGAWSPGRGLLGGAGAEPSTCCSLCSRTSGTARLSLSGDPHAHGVSLPLRLPGECDTQPGRD